MNEKLMPSFGDAGCKYHRSMLNAVAQQREIIPTELTQTSFENFLQ